MRLIGFAVSTLVVCFLSSPLAAADQLLVGRYQEQCTSDNKISVIVLPGKRAQLILDDYEALAAPLTSGSCDGQVCYSSKASLDLSYAADDFWHGIRRCYGNSVAISLSEMQPFGDDTLYLKAFRPWKYSSSGCDIEWENREYVLTKCR